MNSFEFEIEQHKAEIMQLLQKGDNNHKIYPLSYSQQALWFLHQLAPENAAYNITFSARINTCVNTPALQRAFQILIARHPSLRTTFSIKNGKLSQEIHSYQDLSFTELDASTWSEDELNQWVVNAYKHPFNLTQRPLLRVSLLTRSNQDYIFLVTLHHIICDEWSLRILLEELQSLYLAEKDGSTASLPSTSHEYTDYVKWQTEMLASSTGKQLQEYWQKQLAGEIPILNLPIDRPRPPIQTYQGASSTFKLKEELAQQLYKLAQTEKVDPYIIILSAFQLLLYRYTTQEDILVGLITTGREKTKFIRTVGHFVNPVVLRTNFSKNLTFKAFLHQVHNTVSDAIAHQNYPFPLLVNQLQPNRDPSRSPLFQVSFVVQDTQSQELTSLLMPNQTQTRINWGGLEFEPFQISQQEGQFDLTLEVVDTRETIWGVLKYNTDLFDAATIDRIAENLQTLLKNIIENPLQPIFQLPLLSQAEENQVLREWNSTQIECSHNICFHQLFHAQAEQTPDVVAVVCEGEHLTYRELNHQANQLAHYLQNLGVEPEVLVGIYMERSLDIIVGLLGILKAGGAFVPLDPAYPQERLAFILSDSQVSVLLTQQKLLTKLPQHEAQTVCLDKDWKTISKFEKKNPVKDSRSDNLAYMIYTSGSTGKPKGVLIEHKGMLNHLYAKILELNLTDADIVAQNASQSFDISVWQFFAALLVGGRVHIFKDEITHDPAQILAQVQHQRISILEIVPSLLQAMLKQVEFCDRYYNLSTLRWLLLTGETLPPELCIQWLNDYPDIPMLNAYGPTECSDDVAHYPIYQSPGSEILNIPIGHSVANMQLYVLDSHLQPLPIGVIGELYVGGVGVGRGYLNRAERTAEVFVPNPFALTPGERLYKTGDLARYQPNGNVEFLGRLDYQVKIRGFRIELGEIEAVLAQYQGMRETAVIAYENHLGGKSLVAYIVLKQEQSLSITDLRHFLKQKLPEYMLPETFVRLEALPLTPNGKIDRHALHAPDSYTNNLEKDCIAPRDFLEFQLVQIWKEVLNVQDIGVKDNFFDLGGNSLLVIRLSAQIQQQFKKNLPLTTLLQHATCEQLSIILRQHVDSLPLSPLVTIQQSHAKKPPMFCVHPDDGNILCYADLAHHLSANQPVYGLQATGLTEEQKPFIRIEDIASQYIKALQTVQAHEPYLIVGWSFGGLVAFEMAQQLQAQGQEVSILALLNTYIPSLAFEFLAEQDDLALLIDLLFKNVPCSLNHLRRLRPDKQIISVIEQAKQINLIPLDYGIEQAKRLLQLYKSHRRFAQNYRPQPYKGRMSFFKASEKTLTFSQDPTLGWGKLVKGIEIYEVPGNHHTIIHKPHVQTLAEKLQLLLETTT